MKKIMIATLGLSLLPVGAMFAQNTSSSSTMGTDSGSGTMKSTKKSRKHKSTKSTSSDTMGGGGSSSTGTSK